MDILLSPVGLLGLAALASVVVLVVVRYRAQNKAREERLARRVSDVVNEGGLQSAQTTQKRKPNRGG